MIRSLAHRGPDAEGMLIDGPIALGHRRLSVLDLSAAANQPMSDATGRYTLVFNGEIYNFRDLRARLEQIGHTFATNSDTEVVLEAISAWGTAALDSLVGMFALALWDKRQQRLLLARDRLGKKPLFYAHLPGRALAFASEPRAVAVHPSVHGDVDATSLAHYLRLNYVPCNRTLFTGIESLPPACYAEFDTQRGLRLTRYWDLAAKFRDKRHFRSRGEAAEALAALIDDAVRIRLVSDVPLGAWLSGGIDSSTVVASMRRERDPASILTFSSGFVEDSYDESPVAAGLAGELGVAHRTQTLDPGTNDLLPAVMASSAEPLADSSMLPMFFLSQFTRQQVTVALSGDGGDECFAGYETYLADKLHRIARHSPRWLRERLPRALDAVLPVDHRKVAWPEKLRRFSSGLALDSARAHASWRDIFAHGELHDLVRRDLHQHDWPGTSQELFDDYFANHFADVAECDPLDQASYVDIKTWLVDDILVKTDRASMAHALEVRCPLLDHRVVEFGAQLPVDLKLRGFDKKHILKLSQRSRLPDRILRRPKQGFNAPVSHWVRGPLRELCEDTLFSPTVCEWFDQRVIRRLWRDHLTRERDNGLKLFGLLTVGLFLNQRVPKILPSTAERVQKIDCL